MSNDAPATQNEYSGTPEEVGGQLVADALGPTIQAAFESANDDSKVARMMAGMIAGLAVMVINAFGKEAAIHMLRGTADKIEEALRNEAGKPH